MNFSTLSIKTFFCSCLVLMPVYSGMGGSLLGSPVERFLPSVWGGGFEQGKVFHSHEMNWVFSTKVKSDMNIILRKTLILDTEFNINFHVLFRMRVHNLKLKAFMTQRRLTLPLSVSFESIEHNELCFI